MQSSTVFITDLNHCSWADEKESPFWRLWVSVSHQITWKQTVWVHFADSSDGEASSKVWSWFVLANVFRLDFDWTGEEVWVSDERMFWADENWRDETMDEVDFCGFLQDLLCPISAILGRTFLLDDAGDDLGDKSLVSSEEPGNRLNGLEEHLDLDAIRFSASSSSWDESHFFKNDRFLLPPPTLKSVKSSDLLEPDCLPVNQKKTIY